MLSPASIATSAPTLNRNLGSSKRRLRTAGKAREKNPVIAPACGKHSLQAEWVNSSLLKTSKHCQANTIAALQHDQFAERAQLTTELAVMQHDSAGFAPAA